jgi:hypothetical protein
MGQRLRGRVKATYLRGEQVYAHGDPCPFTSMPRGREIRAILKHTNEPGSRQMEHSQR